MTLPTLPRPPMIRTDSSNEFAHHTMRVRIPEIVGHVLASNPDYPESIQRELAALQYQIAHGAVIPMLDLPAPDYDDWLDAFKHRQGDTWHNTDWFYAETFFYRHVIQAVRWWETGRDPFRPAKAAELASQSLWELVNGALAIQKPVEARLAAHLDYALWGNRLDLSYRPAAEHGSTSTCAEDLLIDTRSQTIEHLMGRPGKIHVVADNFGTELAADLVLIDTLLHEITDRVIVHVKMHPTYVSDATASDVRWLIREFSNGQHGNRITGLGNRLEAALADGQLRIAPDFFWNSSRALWEMPHRLIATFESAGLTILKGDANYRRLLGDAIWPPDTAFGDVAAYYPASLAALRILKSDPIVGLSPDLAATLDATDPRWRVNGQRGVIQTLIR